MEQMHFQAINSSGGQASHENHVMSTHFLAGSEVIAYCYATVLAVSTTAGASSHLEAFT